MSATPNVQDEDAEWPPCTLALSRASERRRPEDVGNNAGNDLVATLERACPRPSPAPSRALLHPGLQGQGSRARAPGPDQSSRLRFLSLCLSFLCLSSLPCFELLPCLSFLCELLFLCDLCPLLSLWLFSFLLFFDEPFASN